MSRKPEPRPGAGYNPNAAHFIPGWQALSNDSKICYQVSEDDETIQNVAYINSIGEEPIGYLSSSGQYFQYIDTTSTSGSHDGYHWEPITYRAFRVVCEVPQVSLPSVHNDEREEVYELQEPAADTRPKSVVMVKEGGAKEASLATTRHYDVPARHGEPETYQEYLARIAKYRDQQERATLFEDDDEFYPGS